MINRKSKEGVERGENPAEWHNAYLSNSRNTELNYWASGKDRDWRRGKNKWKREQKHRNTDTYSMYFCREWTKQQKHPRVRFRMSDWWSHVMPKVKKIQLLSLTVIKLQSLGHSGEPRMIFCRAVVSWRCAAHCCLYRPLWEVMVHGSTAEKWLQVIWVVMRLRL